MTSDLDLPATRPAMGQIPTTGRGALPFALLDGEPLVALASRALDEAGVVIVDFTVELAGVRDQGRALVLHDPLCPLTPPSFLREAVELAEDGDVVVVAVQPVTDTIKTAPHGVVGDTVDREGLWLLASPVVLPASVVAGLDRWPDADDLPALVGGLRAHGEVRFLEAPVLARRVDDESAVAVLAALADEQRAVEGQRAVEE